MKVEGRPLALSALKAGEDGKGLVLRLYEPSGGTNPGQITAAPGWALGEEITLLEEPAASGTSFGPFQIRSFRLAPT